jgi:hypothetical protein
MNTKVTTEFDADPEFGKVIAVKHGDMTIGEWAATYLSPEENAQWLKQDRIHEAAVHAAVAAGDCEIDLLDTLNAAVKWRSQEIHQKWMDTIAWEDHEIYRSFWDRYHNHNDKNFCPELWQRVFISQFDDKFYAKPCCLITPSDTTEVVLTDPTQLFDHYNQSACVTDLREQNRQGKLDPGCNVCVVAERTTGSSTRRYAASMLTPGQSLTPMSHVDLNLGNLCNLSCAICGPASSTSWVPVWKNMHNELPTIASYNKNNRPEIDDPAFFKNIQVLQLQGGEVFLQPEYTNFFNKLKKYKNLNEIQVTIFTNGTVLPAPAFLELLKECKLVQLWVSIDDIGDRFEYQRRGAKWANVLENLHWYNAYCQDTFQLGFNVTQSLLNVFYLSDTYNFLTQQFPKFVINNNPYNDSVGLLSISHLPESIKIAIVNKNKSNAALSMLENIITVDNSYKFNAAIEYIQKYNAATATSYADTHPEFWKLITEYNEGIT